MNILIIPLVIALTILALIYLMKTGKIVDVNKNLVPDKVEKIVKETGRRVGRVKEELADVKSSAKNLVKQSKDVIDAVKGDKRKGPSKPSTKNKK